MQPLPIPARFTDVLEGMPAGEPFNVGQMYYQFGQAIRNGGQCQPDFATAVELHHLVDALRQSSDTGQAVAVG